MRSEAPRDDGGILLFTSHPTGLTESGSVFAVNGNRPCCDLWGADIIPLDRTSDHHVEQALSVQQPISMRKRISESDLRDIDAQRICVIKPSALGDVVQTLPLLPVLKSIETQFPIEFLVIANTNPEYQLESFKFKAWSLVNPFLSLYR